ncbi:hypothetical protein PPZ62_09280, partial [Aquirufa nivalisilvae]
TTVTVNTPPTVSATQSQTVCAGTKVTLSGSGASTYAWDNGISNGVEFTATETKTYTVTGTDANGCTNTATTTVTVNTPPTVSATQSQTVCAGTKVTLSGSGASTYAWDNGISNGVEFTATETKTYTVTGTDANGCTNTATTTVTVNTPPTVSATQSQTVCAGTKVTLSGSGASTYAWDNDISNGVEFTATETKTYTVTGTDANGCTNTATTTVTVNTPPTVSATQSQTVCAGTKVTLWGSGASTYAWDNGISNGVEFTATETKTYTVTGTDANGCTNTATTTVTVNTPPTVSVNSTTICAGGQTTLTANGASSYSWSNSASGASINVSPGSTTTYTVTGTSNGCTGTAVAKVTVNPVPSVSVSRASFTVCTNNSISLSLAGASPANGTWSIVSGGGSINGGNYIAGGSSENVTLRYEYSNGSCSNATTITINVSNCQVLCTYTQGYYGNTGGMSCNGIDPETGNSLGQSTTLERLKSAFNNAGVSEVTFGDRSKGKFFIFRSSDVASTSSNIFKMLPGGGTPTSLNANANGWTSTASGDSKSPVNNKGKIVNNLLSQTITLWLNIQTSSRLGSWTLPKSFKTVKPDCGTTKIDGLSATTTTVTPSLVGYSVNDLLKLANRALGGALGGNDPSLNDIFTTVDQINNAFDQCRYLVSQEAPSTYKTASLTEETMFRTVTENTEIVSTVVAYPNPFVSKVSFLIKAKLNGRATLGLYNISGLKIADLFDGEMTENQEQQVEYTVPSGSGVQTYIYMFQQAGQIVRGKIVGE